MKHLAEKSKYVAINERIEDERCKGDLLYRLFRRPETLAYKLLDALVDVIKKKNSPDLERSSMFNDAIDFLLKHPHVDWHAQVFYILVILNKDTDAQTLFKNGYAKGNLWKDEHIQHFERFLTKLNELIENTMLAPFGEVNVAPIVRSFVTRAEQLYLGC